ncbi:MAG: RNA 2'-phosphotransferase [Theionarchaea archaeon]|nr:RNA 2'-phosphotransferase [Theionarchaea archaeon]
MENISSEKKCIREKIWKEMKKGLIERFPYAWGRIPNFEGAEKAAQRLAALEEFKKAKIIFVAPDSPQKLVRELVLTHGKILVMPTPRLKSGFILLKPKKGLEKKASSIKGAFKLGNLVSITEVPEVDFVVQGAVAVDLLGGRLGKGGGYGDKEVALLRKHKKIVTAQISVTVHDIQVVEKLPQDEWDFTVDIIVTPTRVIRTSQIEREDVSKCMSYYLRHHPPRTMSRDGFVLLDELVTLVQERYTVDEEYITSIVETDTKGRFQLQDRKIRALYGHSYPVDIDLPLADIDLLYHGTTEKAAQSILKEGLKPKGRQKVHLSPTPDTAGEVGMRRCRTPVILQIDVRRALKNCIIIEKASDLVYVADFVPPEYIKKRGTAEP